MESNRDTDPLRSGRPSSSQGVDSVGAADETPQTAVESTLGTNYVAADETSAASNAASDRPHRNATPPIKSSGVPAAGVLAGASLLCCAAIHAVAVWSHRNVPTEARLFFAAAIGQLIIGTIACLRWNKVVRALIIVSSVVITTGWLLSRTRGLPVFGVETVGMGDAVSSALQMIAAVLAAFVPALSTPRRQPLRAFAGAGAVTLAAGFLAVPATLDHGHDENSFTGSISAVWGAHEHIHTSQAAAGLTGNGVVQDQPKSCHPTVNEVGAADTLVARTQIALQKYEDPQAALDAGFVPLGFEPNGVYHYLNRVNMVSDDELDPDKPESIVYGRQPDGSIHPIGVMFMASKIGEHGPKPGGCLMTWHSHGWPFAAPGQQSVEMVHVWTIPVPGGPFAHESGPDYARIYLNKTPVGPDEVNLLLEDAFTRYKANKLDPKMIGALSVLALGGADARCSAQGKSAMTTLRVSTALQEQVCDPLLSKPVPGADNGGLFRSLGRGVLTGS